VVRYWLGLLGTLLIIQQFSSGQTTTTNNWAGTNFYYLWACNQTQREYYLDIIQATELKVLRIFILHSCTEETERCQGPNTCQTLPFDVEEPVGVWHDEVLLLIDQLMYECYQRGIKLTIALHDRWSLGCWRWDAYVRKYNLPTTSSCSTDTQANTPDLFYTSSEAISDFKNRIEHILTHQNQYFDNRPWSDLTEVIFSIQPENEPRFESNPSWMGEVTSYMKKIAPKLLITSGGPGGGLPEPSPTQVAAIPTVDILSIHNYSKNISSDIAANREAALQYGKRYLLEEFGFGNYDNPQLQAAQYLAAISSARIPYEAPWMFWMLGPPPSENSLNVFPGNLAFDAIIVPEIIATSSSQSTQSWPEIWNSSIINTRV